MSFLLLIVLLAIMAQLKLATHTEMRVAENDVALTTMDLAIESALLEIKEQLLADAEAAGGAAAGAASGAGDFPEAGGGEGEEAPASVDSREDEWGRPVRTTIGEVDLRILVQDEDSKINVLGLLSRDEDVAEQTFEQIARVLEMFRGDSSEEVGRIDAERMAERIRDHLLRRRDGEDELPQAVLLTTDPRDLDRAVPLTLRELAVFEPFHPGHFRDHRDEDGLVVHALTSYLTVYSGLASQDEANRASAEEGSEAAPGDDDQEDQQGGGGDPPEEGAPAEGGEDPAAAAAADEGGSVPSGAAGYAVNLNTAPPVVLKALQDERDVRMRFWDEVIAYRNEEEEPEDSSEEEVEPVYDEFGEEIIARQVFDSLEELGDVDGWLDLEPEVRDRLQRQLTVSSNVFSIYVTARMAGDEESELGGFAPRNREEARAEEDASGAITRTVRSVVWRRQTDDGWQLVPIVRWEVLDYAPYEVLDDPDAER